MEEAQDATQRQRQQDHSWAQAPAEHHRSRAADATTAQKQCDSALEDRVQQHEQVEGVRHQLEEAILLPRHHRLQIHPYVQVAVHDDLNNEHGTSDEKFPKGRKKCRNRAVPGGGPRPTGAAEAIGALVPAESQNKSVAMTTIELKKYLHRAAAAANGEDLSTVSAFLRPSFLKPF
jgi:hypothetical protein